MYRRIDDIRRGFSAMGVESSDGETVLEEAFRLDPDLGIELLDSEFGELIFRRIKRVAWSSSLDDRLDIYQETLLAMLQRARRPDFDTRRPLRLAQAIACRKAVDHLRKRHHRLNADDDAVLSHIAADLKDTNLGFEWKYLGPVEWSEFRKALLEVLATLPERQRVVAQAFVDHYEDFKERDTYLPLAEAVGRVTGRRESVVGVKSAWADAKRKIIAEMSRRGFNYLDGSTQ